MRVARAAAGILILTAATVWGQSTTPVTATAGRPFGSRRVMASPPGSRMTSVQTASALKRMQAMEETLKKMRALLKQMSAKAGASGASKDPIARANLEMWQLMLGHLDAQFAELRTATLAREDLNARRAAMYQQAEAKAAAEAARATATGTAGAGALPGMAGAAAATETTSTPASSTPK
jgi:hypothetical protein